MKQPVSALYLFHVVLIVFGILFSFGFALYQLTPYSRAGSGEKLALGIVFAVGGLGLSAYLFSVLRHGLGGKPPRSR